jgi:hypothetical protein
MQYKITSFPPVYSHIALESLIQGVSSSHIAAFPPSFFKNYWIDNKRSVQNFFRKQRLLGDRKLPSVVAGYEIEDNPKNTLENGDFPFNYASHFIAGPLSTYYYRIYHNPHTNIVIYAAFIRKKVTLTFRYLFPDSYMRDDIYMWMLHQFRYEGPPEKYGINKSIYSAMPQSLLDYLASLQSYNLEIEDIKKLYHSELQEYSSGLLRNRKVSMKDSNSMWFLTYQLPLMKMIQSEKPSKEDGERRGQIKTGYGITEVLECEPYVPSMFIIKTPSVVYGKRVPDVSRYSIYGNNKGIDPRLKRTRNYEADPIPRLLLSHPEYQVLSSIEFCIDHDGQEDIEIDESIFGPFHQHVISLLKNKKVDIRQYYQIHIFAFYHILHENKNYSINWNDMKITIYSSHSSYLYRIIGTCTSNLIRPYYKTAKLRQQTYLHKE